jgi:SSS family solute:Na+ symporter
MRHITLGDWFVERYQSQRLGVAYTAFALMFMVMYGSMFFSAIGKVAATIVGTNTVMLMGQAVGLEYVLVPIIGIVVLIYGIMGGLEAAYITDLIQGLCIIVLSIILIPFGLQALIDKFDPGAVSLFDGFRIMHEQLPKEHFTILGSSNSEFPLHRIVAVVIINLIGVVIQPHFIATGGGSAKTEMNARVGLVVGNFLKRFCTVGWVLTALIALALYADDPDLILDPERTWGVASKNLLGPGLTGLMLACLLAALMSSIDAYMVVGSALMVRNVYLPYINPKATERDFLRIGRLTGVVVVAGSVIVSLSMMNVFKQLQLTWVVPILFAAPFWVGLYWRRATAGAAWGTFLSCAVIFFLTPLLLPIVMPSTTTNQMFAKSNDVVVTTTLREAAPSDVAKRNAIIREIQALTEQIAAKTFELSGEPNHAEQLREEIAAMKTRRRSLLANGINELTVGDVIPIVTTSRSKSIYWSGGVTPIDENGKPLKGVVPVAVGEPEKVDDRTTIVRKRFAEDVRFSGNGNLNLEFLLYDVSGFDLIGASNATLSTLELPPKIIFPFIIMIVLSLVTKPLDAGPLDRYYAKMKTPVNPDPELDKKALDEAYANPQSLEHKKLFPGSSLEFQRPNRVDIGGFLICVLTCFAVIWAAMLIVGIGA